MNSEYIPTPSRHCATVPQCCLSKFASSVCVIPTVETRAKIDIFRLFIFFHFFAGALKHAFQGAHLQARAAHAEAQPSR